jgi:hypothetical protein
MSVTRLRGSVHAEPTALTLSRASLAELTLLFAGLAAAGVGLSVGTQAAVYLVGMVALNLPHGGYEHFANLRRRAMRFRGRYVAGYLLFAGAFVGLFLLASVAGLALAVTVAVLKGGGGDLHVLEATTGTGHLRSRGQRLLAVAARGGDGRPPRCVPGDVPGVQRADGGDGRPRWTGCRSRLPPAGRRRALRLGARRPPRVGVPQPDRRRRVGGRRR